MNVLENSFKYVTRKKKKTVILFSILLFVLLAIYVCFGIISNISGIEKKISENTLMSYTITKKFNLENTQNIGDGKNIVDGNQQFYLKDVQNIEKNSNVENVVYEREKIAKALNCKVVEGEKNVLNDYVDDNLSNVVKLIETSDVSKNILFASGSFEIVEGRKIAKNEKNKIIVHREFAKKNNLKLNDKIILKEANANNLNEEKHEKEKNKEKEYEIVGIYEGKGQEKYTGLTSDYTENQMFASYVYDDKEGENKNDTLNSINVYMKNIGKTKEAKDNAKDNTKDNVESILDDLGLDKKKYDIQKNNEMFSEIADSITEIKEIITISVISVIFVSIVVITLILLLWLRERYFEIGVLMSIGKKRRVILLQFLIEILIISIPATIVANILGGAVLNNILKKLIATNLKGSYMANLIVFAKSYGVLLAIILLSLIISNATIIFKNPKDILKKGN